MNTLALSQRIILWRYGLFGSAVAFAGPPVYIHLPKLYAEHHGLGLAVIGGVLLVLRAIDFVQDPLLSWAIARWHAFRTHFVAGFSALLVVSMFALFGLDPLLSPVAWLSLTLIGVFTGFSGLQIIYYGSGVNLGERFAGGHERVAAWREAGILAGVCLACVAPSLFAALVGTEKRAYALYALAFTGLFLLAYWRSGPVWRFARASTGTSGFYYLFRDRLIRRLLILGFFNSLPIGLTATLFLFYVEYRLEAPSHAGPMLLLFFLAAAIAAPFWGRVAESFGPKPTLALGMLLAISSFVSAWLLGPGDWQVFYFISIASGAAVAADMTLLPAMLSARVSAIGGGRDLAFGLWGFVNKSTLAIAAGTALPGLAVAGFDPGAANSAEALDSVAFAYALLPCLLKLIALTILLRISLGPDENPDRAGIETTEHQPQSRTIEP